VSGHDSRTDKAFILSSCGGLQADEGSALRPERLVEDASYYKALGSESFFAVC